MILERDSRRANRHPKWAALATTTEEHMQATGPARIGAPVTTPSDLQARYQGTSKTCKSPFDGFAGLLTTHFSLPHPSGEIVNSPLIDIEKRASEDLEGPWNHRQATFGRWSCPRS